MGSVQRMLGPARATAWILKLEEDVQVGIAKLGELAVLVQDTRV